MDQQIHRALVQSLARDDDAGSPTNSVQATVARLPKKAAYSSVGTNFARDGAGSRNGTPTPMQQQGKLRVRKRSPGPAMSRPRYSFLRDTQSSASRKAEAQAAAQKKKEEAEWHLKSTPGHGGGRRSRAGSRSGSRAGSRSRSPSSRAGDPFFSPLTGHADRRSPRSPDDGANGGAARPKVLYGLNGRRIVTPAGRRRARSHSRERGDGTRDRHGGHRDARGRSSSSHRRRHHHGSRDHSGSRERSRDRSSSRGHRSSSRQARGRDTRDREPRDHSSDRRSRRPRGGVAAAASSSRGRSHGNGHDRASARDHSRDTSRDRSPRPTHQSPPAATPSPLPYMGHGLGGDGEYFSAADALAAEPMPHAAGRARAAGDSTSPRGGSPHRAAAVVERSLAAGGNGARDSPIDSAVAAHGRGGRGQAALQYRLQVMEREFASSTDMSSEERAELADVRNQLRLTYERTVAVDDELQGVEQDLATVSRHLALLQRTVDEELMLNANLAKLALKSTSPDFDTAAAAFIRNTLKHSRGAMPTHAIMREIIEVKFDALEGGTHGSPSAPTASRQAAESPATPATRQASHTPGSGGHRHTDTGAHRHPARSRERGRDRGDNAYGARSGSRPRSQASHGSGYQQQATRNGGQRGRDVPVAWS